MSQQDEEQPDPPIAQDEKDEIKSAAAMEDEVQESKSRDEPVSILHHGTTAVGGPSRYHKRCVSFGEDVRGTEEEEMCAQTEARSSDEEDPVGEKLAGPSLLRDRRSASMAAMNSFRESCRNLSVSSSTLRDDISGADRWKPWVSWSIPRFQWTALGCLSSTAVLTIRLMLDTKPTAYLIHSIIVFLDMVLIHLFTNSPWLSIAGECLTIVFFLSFHFTKETLFELLETTLIAVLCSFHLILSRNKHKHRNQELEADMMSLRQSSIYLLRNIDDVDKEELESLPGGLSGWLSHMDSEKYKQKLKVIGDNFFEHFLDGSAGVMYTSFLGLIIDEILTYGESKGSY